MSTDNDGYPVECEHVGKLCRVRPAFVIGVTASLVPDAYVREIHVCRRHLPEVIDEELPRGSSVAWVMVRRFRP